MRRFAFVILFLVFGLGTLHAADSPDDAAPPDKRVRTLLSGTLAKADTIGIYTDAGALSFVLVATHTADGEMLQVVYLIRPPNLILVMADSDYVVVDTSKVPCQYVWYHRRYISKDGKILAKELPTGTWERELGAWCRPRAPKPNAGSP